MSAAIEELERKKEALKYSQQESWNNFQNQIDDIETAIRILSGEKVDKFDRTTQYNDEDPTYISGTEDGI